MPDGDLLLLDTFSNLVNPDRKDSLSEKLRNIIRFVPDVCKRFRCPRANRVSVPGRTGSKQRSFKILGSEAQSRAGLEHPTGILI